MNENNIFAVANGISTSYPVATYIFFKIMEKGNRLFHKLDKYLGIPIAMFLGIPKLFYKNKLPKTIKRIAILNIGSIGDNVVMSGPIRDLRTQYPQAEIVAFTGSTNYQTVKLISSIDQVIKLPITNPLKALQILRSQGRVDLLFDFGPWPRLNSIYAFFIKASFKIGFKAEGQYRHYIYDKPVQHSFDLHEIENFRNLIAGFANNPSCLPQLRFNKTEKIDSLLKTFGRFCVIHPWASGYKAYMKNWSVENWQALLLQIQPHFDSFLLTGGPNDIENSAFLYKSLQTTSLMGKVYDLSGKVNINELTHVLSHSSMVFSVNTGVAHIAAALEKSQICLHGPTNAERWGPVSDKTVSLTPKEGHYGYLKYGFEYDDGIQENCTNNILVEDVYSAFCNMLPTLD